MALTISDETLQAAGLTEREALIELACHFFDTERLELWPAAQLAGLTRTEFEAECLDRKIPLYRPTIEDFRRELEVVKELERHA